MRITRDQLHDLINEEIATLLVKKENKRLTEGATSTTLKDVSADELLDFCVAYARLGQMVAAQLVSIVEDHEATVDTNAVEKMKEVLGGKNDEIDAAIRSWEEEFSR
jgi:uncharacterized membrane protein